MWVYIITFSFSIFATYLLDKGNPNGKDYVVKAVGDRGRGKVQVGFNFFKSLLASMPLIFISTVRWGVGSDFYSYRQEFLGLQDSHKEAVFGYLTKMIRISSGSNYTLYLLLFALITTGVTFLAIWDQSDDKALSVFYYLTTTFFFCGLNAMRQGAAIAISLYAIKFLYRKKPFWFVFWIIIGSLLHESILICLIMLFVKNIDLKPPRVLVILALLFGFNSQIKSLIEMIAYHTSYYHFFYDQYGITVPLTYIIMILATFIVATYIKKNYVVDDAFNVYYNYIFAALIIGCICNWLPMGRRLMWNFMFVMILILPKIRTYLSDKNRLFFNVSYGALFFAGMYSNIVINADHTVVPYHWIL